MNGTILEFLPEALADAEEATRYALSRDCNSSRIDVN